jgi:molybdopterin converting factor small subunit
MVQLRIMRIFVKIGEPLWRAVGARSLTLTWDRPTVTVAEALERLHRDYPGFGPAFRGQGLRLTVDYQTFVNSRMIKPEERSDAEIKDADKLFIFLPAVGGGT